MKLKVLFANHLIAAYDQVSALQQANGQFLDDRVGYSTYGQYVGYYFAWLSTYAHPDNPYYRDAQTLERAVRGWDYYASTVLPTGKVPIITYDRYWSDTIDEWGFFYWLETIELITDELEPETRRFWTQCLHCIGEALVLHVQETAASEAFAEGLATHNAHNHFVWSVLAMYRYGRFCNDEAICSEARTIMERILDAQLECGTWLEGGTAVVGYGSVTSCAVSLFELADDNAAARAAIARNFSYVRATTFPNMQANDCIDGRVGFGQRPFAYTAPTFYRYREGCAYLTRWIDLQAAPSLEDGRGLERKLQGVAVITGIAAALDDELPADYETILRNDEAITQWPELQARIERRDGWTVAYCGLASTTQESRWRMQRQNLVSVFHQATGLLVGGGHSVAQPEFSCFNIISNGRAVYLHDMAELRDDSLHLQYGSTWCQVQAAVNGPDSCHLRYNVEELNGNDRAQVNVPLWIQGLTEIQIGSVSHCLEDDGLFLNLPQGTVLDAGKFKLKCNADARLLYPVDGYSPYVQEKDSDPKRRQAILQVKLYPWQTACEIELHATTP